MAQSLNYESFPKILQKQSTLKEET